jgi:acetate---CoA ligase (ADP-forming)
MTRLPSARADTPPPPGPVPSVVTGRLRDGTAVRIRPALPADLPQILDFLTHISPESLARRFIAPVVPERVARDIVAAHGSSDRVSLIVEVAAQSGGPIVALGEYERGTGDPTRAEVVFLVSDRWQGLGAATLLLLRLARLAASMGVQQFEAVTLAENQPMIDVFLGSGYPCSITWHLGEGLILLDIGHEPAPPGVPRGDSRDRATLPA